MKNYTLKIVNFIIIIRKNKRIAVDTLRIIIFGRQNLCNSKLILWYYSNGNKYHETIFIGGKYQDGLMHVKEIFWYDNGTKKSECDYQNNKLHGKEIWWYDNGIKKYECEYQNGLKYGKEIWWFEDGAIEYNIINN